MVFEESSITAQTTWLIFSNWHENLAGDQTCLKSDTRLRWSMVELFQQFRWILILTDTEKGINWQIHRSNILLLAHYHTRLRYNTYCVGLGISVLRCVCCCVQSLLNTRFGWARSRGFMASYYVAYCCISPCFVWLNLKLDIPTL